MFRALTKNPRARAVWEFRGSPGGAFDGEHGLDLAMVRSSARSQEHLTNARAKKKNKSRQLDEVAAQVLQEPQHKGRLGDAFVYDVHRMSVLWKSPKEARASIRAAREPGFYISSSGMRKLRSLHQLGKCYILPGVVVMNYMFAGNALSKKAEYDNVCRLCASVGVQNQFQAASWMPELVRDQHRLTTPRVGFISSSSFLVGVSLVHCFLGFLLFPGLVFCGCLRQFVCVCVCVCAGACLCLWCSMLGPSGSCPGRFSGPVSWGFLGDLARHIGDRTSPRLIHISFGSPQS